MSERSHRSGKAILAAGGVVWRIRGGAPDVLVVHRPRYDDWTLPKGKLEAAETELAAAVREVGEETGLQVAVQRRIATVKYDTDQGRKRVTYWSMRHTGGAFESNAEVDQVEWLRVGRAYRKLSYDVDRAVLADFAAMPVAESVIILVRHAKAGRRSDWRGDDRLRPLDPYGDKQAVALAELIALFGPTRVIAADLTRCQQTVQPLADKFGLDVELEPAFADERFDESSSGTPLALLALGRPGEVTVLCSQGLTIPALVDRLGPGIRSSETRKGAWWVLTLVDGDVTSLDHYDAP